jgi:apolipoprotein N-acyltransferase
VSEAEMRRSHAAPSGANKTALILYAVLTFLSFPHEIPFLAQTGGEWFGRTSFDLGLLFAWFVPAALVLGIEGMSPRRATRAAFWASLVGHSVFFYWFVIVTVQYGGMPLFLGLLAPLAPALYVSLFTALFAGCWAARSSRGASSFLFGAALWVAVDWARGHFLGGFPWATLGYALHLDLPLLAWTRWVGVYGLSFVAAAGGIALAHAWRARDRPSAIRLAGVVIAGVALHLVGYAMNQGEDSSESELIRVAAIQGNIDQGEKWDENRRNRILSTYLRLSEEAGAQGVDWIVWPETAVPGLIDTDPTMRDRIGLLAHRYGASLVVGGVGVEVDVRARQFSAFFDSAYQFGLDGEVRDRYDKTHLVPFGEFLPLRGLLGHFFQSLALGLATDDVTAGPAPRNLALEVSGGAGETRSVGVAICYELLFPHLVGEFGAQGADALLAITNDAWYGRSGAPHQFLAMTAMRAAEIGRPTVRAANTGISAIIDSEGRVEKATPLFEEAVVIGEIRLPRSKEPTFYARFGDVFAWGCIVASLVGLWSAWIGAMRGRSEDPTIENDFGTEPRGHSGACTNEEIAVDGHGTAIG